MSNLQRGFIIRATNFVIVALLSVAFPGLAAGGTVTGKYYSDRVVANCTASPCVLSFSQTPDTTTTVKVQNLSCLGPSYISTFTFRVVGAGGSIVAERFSTAADFGGSSQSRFNVPIANIGTPMAIPRKGKAQLVLENTGVPNSWRCTITGLYD